MATGKVKFYNETKAFGFIAPDNGGKDVFVHRNGIKSGVDKIRDGAKVQFDVEETPKGLNAINVVVLED